MSLLSFRGAAICAALVGFSSACPAADWPAWRCDSGRTAATSEELPEKLHLQWTRQYPALRPAWPGSARLRFDTGYRPVAAEGKVFVASSHNDSVTALDAVSGAEQWRFYAGGPVRLAPCYWKGRVYFGSDDGYLYCVSVRSGKLLWKYAGAPDVGRKIVGNSRMISTWPVRGAPVIHDGKVYFAAGIWPFMGIFVHAVDALSGKRIWTNSGTGSMFIDQPHSSPAFAGLAPQGYLAVNGDRLLVPNGRSVAACLRRRDGELLYYHHADNDHNGKYFVATRGNLFFNSYKKFRLSDGESLGEQRCSPVLGPRAGYHSEPLLAPGPGRRRAEIPLRWYLRAGGWYKQWGLRGDGAPHLWMQAGSRLYAASGGRLLALEPPRRNGAVPKITWETKLKGRPCSVLAAEGRLFVATLEGRVLCFGAGKVVPKTYGHAVAGVDVDADPWPPAKEVAKLTGITRGYCLVNGPGAVRAGEALVGLGKGFEVVAIVKGDAKLAGGREYLDRRGLYGRRMMLLPDSSGTRLPPYFASLAVFSGNRLPPGSAAGVVKDVYRCLRPYGGTACFQVSDLERVRLAVETLGLPGAEVRRSGSFCLLRRKGSLPNSGSWTHQYGNPANTVSSADRLVRAPLGVLWFGGAGNARILPRHGHGPNPQVAGGRIVIEGPDILRALDVYTGRTLWEANLPGVGRNFDTTRHQPGANALGSNYVTLPEAIYVVHEGRCLVLDASSGTRIRDIVLPENRECQNRKSGWGYIGVCGRYLLAGASPQGRYRPDFSAEGIRTRVPDRRELDRVVAWMGRIRGFKPSARKKNESQAHSVAHNLNLLLGMKDLPGRIPVEEGRDIDAITARLKLFLRANPAVSQRNTRLREINRALMHAACPQVPGKERSELGGWNPEGVSSKRLVALDRKTGRVLWQKTARQAFVHNAICAGGGKIFAVDRYHPMRLRSLRSKGVNLAGARLVAIEAATGKTLWNVDKDVFAPFLSYSGKYDILLQASRPSRDHLPEPYKRILAHRGADGKVLWSREMKRFRGPPMIIGDRVYTHGGALPGLALKLTDGEPVARKSPLTGAVAPWGFTRAYGCGTTVGSPHLLTFRSAAAGFYDLRGDGGTGNIGGFKSGCSSNLIVADGVLSAPDYTRTCECSYQNQSSLGLIHDPAAELWTFNSWKWSGAPIRRVGINFGAPGDRRSGGGTLWLDCPSLGHSSPDIPVRVSPTRPLPAEVIWPYAQGREKVRTRGVAATFRMHSSIVVSGELKWVAASGLREVDRVEIDLGRGGFRKYRLRLHFLEIEGIGAGERVFDVLVQGRLMIRGVDIAREAGGPKRALVRELKDIRVGQKLTLEFKPRRSGRKALISGIEIVREDCLPSTKEENTK